MPASKRGEGSYDKFQTLMLVLVFVRSPPMPQGISITATILQSNMKVFGIRKAVNSSIGLSRDSPGQQGLPIPIPNFQIFLVINRL